MVINIKANEYESMNEIFKKIHQPIYIPEMSEIEILEQDIKKNYLFILFTLAKAELLNDRDYQAKIKELRKLKSIKEKYIKIE